MSPLAFACCLVVAVTAQTSQPVVNSAVPSNVGGYQASETSAPAFLPSLVDSAGLAPGGPVAPGFPYPVSTSHGFVAAPNANPPIECCDVSRWYDNLSFFAGLEGSKQPQDLGVNANMGGRAHMNFGFPIARDWGIGGQIGTGVTYTDAAVGALQALQGTRERFQSFTTAGLFQRGDNGDGPSWQWGVAYDFLSENYYEGINVGQWRGLFSISFNPCNEFGVWWTVPDRGDSATFLGTPLSLKPIGQANAFYRRTWATGAETTIWMGGSESHGEELILFPAAPTTGVQFVYGADIHVPLNDHLALFGEANFITPSDSGTVDAYLGVVFYPGGGALNGRRRRFAPVLPTAGNPTFALDLRR